MDNNKNNKEKIIIVEDWITKSVNSIYKKINQSIGVFNETYITSNIKEKILLDPVIKSCLHQIKNSILARGFEIVNPLKKNDKDYSLLEEITSFIQFCISDGWNDPYNSFSFALYSILSAIENQISITEIKYTYENNNPIFKNKIKWDAWKTRDIELLRGEFDILEDQAGNIVGLKQNNNDLSKFIDNFLIFRLSGSNSTTFSFSNFYNAVYKHWYCKNVIIIIRDEFLELLSKINAFIKLENPPVPGSNESILLNRLLENLQKGGRAYFDKDWDITITNLTQNTSVVDAFQKAIEYRDRQLKMILNKPDSIDNDNSKYGSYSRVLVQFDAYLLNLQFIQMLLEDLINKAIKKLVLLNYNNISVFPKFKLYQLYDDEPTDIRENIRLAIEKNIINTETENEMIRQQLRIPLLNFNSEKGKIEQTEKNLQDFIFKKPKFLSDENIKSINKFYFDIENENLQDIAKTIYNILDTFITIEKTSKILLKFYENASDIISIFDMNIPYKNILKNQFLNIIKEAFNFSKEKSKKIISEQKKNLIDFDIEIETKKIINNLFQYQSLRFISEIEDNILKYYQRNLISGIENGLSEKEIVFNTKKELENFGIADSKIRTMIRTLSTTSINLGVLETTKQSKLLQGFEFTAILDDRTTEQCQRLDGLIIEKDNPKLEKIKPPLHYNCRSLLSPIILENEFREAQQEFLDTKNIDNINAYINDTLKFIPFEFGGEK